MRARLCTGVAAVAALAATLSACGKSQSQSAPLHPSAGATSSPPGAAAAPRSPVPSPEAPAGKPIHVTLEEWAVIPAYSSAPAGRIRFEAQNQGGASHMFVVVRTADPARHLGVSGDTANLAASGKVMARVPPFPSGDTRTVDVRLSPGHYVLLCNVPAHYMAGMRADFTVR